MGAYRGQKSNSWCKPLPYSLSTYTLTLKIFLARSATYGTSGELLQTAELLPPTHTRNPFFIPLFFTQADIKATCTTPLVCMYIIFLYSYSKVKQETYLKPIKGFYPLTRSINRSSGMMSREKQNWSTMSCRKSQWRLRILWESHFFVTVVICRGHSCTLSKVAILNYCNFFCSTAHHKNCIWNSFKHSYHLTKKIPINAEVISSTESDALFHGSSFFKNMRNYITTQLTNSISSFFFHFQ